MKTAYLNLAIFIILIPALFYFELLKVKDINIVAIFFFATALKAVELTVTYLGEKIAKTQSFEHLIFPTIYLLAIVPGIIYGSHAVTNFLLAAFVYLVIGLVIETAKKKN